MKKNCKTSVIALISVLLLSLLFSLPISASSSPTPPDDLDGRAVCLYDLTHKRILVMENEEESLNTSTSAKVMMGLIACEMLCDRLDEVVTVTKEMIAGTIGYSMGLSVGERITVEDLLYGAICGSYNDAAYTLAHVCAGGVDDFVALMNARAIQLGAKSTNYVNPIGYPDNAAMVTTLSDTLNIAIAASENELFMDISSATKHDVDTSVATKQRTVYNRNYLVCTRSNDEYFNPLCRGMNAGNTGEGGGWSIITLAEDDGAKYICIVLGGTETDSRITAYDTVNRLVDWACESYNAYPVFKKGQSLGKTTVHLTALGSSEAEYVALEPLSIYIPDHSDPDITYHVEMKNKKLSAPIKAGEEIGKAFVYCNGELVGECPITLEEDFELSPIMSLIDKLGGYTQSRPFIITVVVFVILLPIALLFVKSKDSYGGRYKRIR